MTFFTISHGIQKRPQSYNSTNLHNPETGLKKESKKKGIPKEFLTLTPWWIYDRC